MKRKRLLWLLSPLLMLALLIGNISVYADVPPPPHPFYGTLTIAGSPAPIGTVVTAEVANVQVGSITTTVAGQYGGSGAFDEKLVVSGDIETGATISFKINGDLADQTYAFSPGADPTELDLTVGVPSPDTTAPGVTITALTPDPTNDNTPTFGGTATDTGSSISSVDYKVDSGSWAAATASDGTFDSLSEDYTFTTAVLLDGAHTVYVRATDAATVPNTTAEVDYASDGFTVDTVAPDVLSTVPSADATGVGIATAVTATFDEDVTAVDLSGITIPGATGVSATLNEATDTLTIAHDAFDNLTSYTVTIPAGAIEDLAGNPNALYTWSFTTGAADVTPPTVLSTVPSADATDVAVATAVTATLSEDIQAGVNFGGIAISGASGVSASIDGVTLTIAHDAFAYETCYTVTIPAGAVKDLAGLSLEEVKVWSFTTEADVLSFTFILPEGWSLLSTPIKLDADSDAMEQIFDTASLASIEISYSWDAVNEQWSLVSTGYQFLPLEATYVKVISGDSATGEFIPSEVLSWPPSRELEPGLNLIGPAPALGNSAFPDMPLDQALASIAEAEGGLTGYTMVISPPHNQTSWTYALGGQIQDLLAFGGYWVVMENADTLYGFSTTPLQE